MAIPGDSELLAEQTAYYRARAREYDEWILRTGRYDRGEAHRRQWEEELECARATLRRHAPLGETLEIACGTGLWTGLLAELSDTLTALDSVTETIAVNAAKHPDARITYEIADIFAWEPTSSYDTIFFGFWLSHVPGGLFEHFWRTVARALRPGGSVLFVDSLKTQRSTARDHHALDDSGVVERRLNNGDTYRIVKRFHDPDTLLLTMEGLGWDGKISPTGEFFYTGKMQLKPLTP